MSEKWVKERAKFTLLKMFKALEKGVELDVNERNAQLEQRNGYFRLEYGSELGDIRRFWVKRDDPKLTVNFRLNRNGLTIRGRGVDIDTTITVSTDGKCRWVVGDEQLDPWQLRKRALEMLFGFL